MPRMWRFQPCRCQPALTKEPNGQFSARNSSDGVNVSTGKRNGGRNFSACLRRRVFTHGSAARLRKIDCSVGHELSDRHQPARQTRLSQHSLDAIQGAIVVMVNYCRTPRGSYPYTTEESLGRSGRSAVNRGSKQAGIADERGSDVRRQKGIEWLTRCADS